MLQMGFVLLQRLEDGVGVLNNKQGFLDCLEFQRLDDWLGSMVDKYWDANYDNLRVVQLLIYLLAFRSHPFDKFFMLD